MSCSPSGMDVEIGFSTRTWIPAEIRERARGTCVLFGVQIIAASGFAVSEASKAEIEGK